MNIRRWLAGCAVTAAAAGGAAFTTPAGATPVSPVVIHKVDLHSTYLRALPRAQHGPIANKMLPRDARIRAIPRRVSTQAATCTEPNCDLAYGGGPVQHSPKVYLLLWGPRWSGTGADTQFLNAFYSGLGRAGDNWSSITGQYSDGSGSPSFSGSVLAGVFQDMSTPAGAGPGGSIDPTNLNAEADAFIQNQRITDTANAQVVIASQSGTCFDDGWVGQPASCADQPAQMYCGWHSHSTSGGETFTNLPYTPDAGVNCGENFVNSGAAGLYDGFSIVGGHEFAETITDPQPDSGWFDASDNISGGEIGDKCAWGGELWGPLGSDPFGNVALSTGTFAMQSLWSNAAGACVMSATAPNVFVKATKLTHPQMVVDGPHARGARAQVWEQAGLAGSNGSLANQSWTVTAVTGGDQVQLKGTNLCLDVAGFGIANGTHVQLWTCNGGVDQRWKPLSGGQLEAVYATTKSGRTMVLDDPGAGGNGTKLQIWQSNGHAQQLWTLP